MAGTGGGRGDGECGARAPAPVPTVSGCTPHERSRELCHGLVVDCAMRCKCAQQSTCTEQRADRCARAKAQTTAQETGGARVDLQCTRCGAGVRFPAPASGFFPPVNTARVTRGLGAALWFLLSGHSYRRWSAATLLSDSSYCVHLELSSLLCFVFELTAPLFAFLLLTAPFWNEPLIVRDSNPNSRRDYLRAVYSQVSRSGDRQIAHPTHQSLDRSP